MASGVRRMRSKRDIEKNYPQNVCHFELFVIRERNFPICESYRLA